jgi:hypothetical protein
LAGEFEATQTEEGMSRDGDGNCELGLPCYNKRLLTVDYEKWAEDHVPLRFRKKIEDEWTDCPCALIMHIKPWACILGLGCQYGFHRDETGRHDCECQTRCVRCLKRERVPARGGLERPLICEKCSHDLHHGVVQKIGKKFFKMYRSGTTVDVDFSGEMPAYSKMPDKTVNACGWCLQEIYDAAKADRYVL